MRRDVTAGMADPYLDAGESFIVTTHRISAGFALYDMMLTTRHIVLVDSSAARFEPWKIPLSTILSVAAGRVATGEPVITLNFVPSGGFGGEPSMNLLFTQQPGEQRKGERDDWVRNLMGQIVAVRQQGEPGGDRLPDAVTGDRRPSSLPLRTIETALPHRSVVAAEPGPVELAIAPEEPEEEAVGEAPAGTGPGNAGEPEGHAFPEELPKAGGAGAAAGEPELLPGPDSVSGWEAPGEVPGALGQPGAPAPVAEATGETAGPDPFAAAVLALQESARARLILPEPDARVATPPTEQALLPDAGAPPGLFTQIAGSARAFLRGEGAGGTASPEAAAPVTEKEPAPRETDAGIITGRENLPETRAVPGSGAIPEPSVPEPAVPEPALPEPAVPEQEEAASAPEEPVPAAVGGPAASPLPPCAGQDMMQEGEERGTAPPAGDTLPPVPPEEGEPPGPGWSPEPGTSLPKTHSACPLKSLVLAAAAAVIVILAIVAVILLSPPAGVGTQPPAAVPALPMSPAPTPAPAPSVAPVPSLPPAPPPSPVPSLGVWVLVTYNGSFVGYVGNPGGLQHVGGSGTGLYRITDSSGLVQAAFEKQDYSGTTLVVSVYRNGTRIATRSVRAPGGSLDFIIDPATGGFPGGIPEPTSATGLIPGRTY